MDSYPLLFMYVGPFELPSIIAIFLLIFIQIGIVCLILFFSKLIITTLFLRKDPARKKIIKHVGVSSILSMIMVALLFVVIYYSIMLFILFKKTQIIIYQKLIYIFHFSFSLFLDDTSFTRL